MGLWNQGGKSGARIIVGGNQRRKVGLGAVRPTKSDYLKNTDAHSKIPKRPSILQIENSSLSGSGRVEEHKKPKEDISIVAVLPAFRTISRLGVATHDPFFFTTFLRQMSRL